MSCNAATAATRSQVVCTSYHTYARVSWTAEKTNEWFLNKAAVNRKLLDIVKARKIAIGSCLDKEIMQETIPNAHRRGRPRTARIDNIKTWTGLTVEESIRMTEDRAKC